jgi:hypothetical protein
VVAVETLSVNTVQLAHTAREVGLCCLDEEMIVVGHEAIGMAMPRKAPDDLAQHQEKDAVVFVIEKDRCACVAAAGEVVERTRKFEAEGASHRGIGKRLLLRFGVVTMGFTLFGGITAVSS